MSDDTAPPARPEYDALVCELAAVARRQESVAKAEAARRNASAVMAKAAGMFSRGEITAHELSKLHAVRLRLDASLAERDRT